ncbi:MAG: response regulator [Bacteroidota bacterium]
MRKKVLIIDDELTMRLLLDNFLKTKDYDVVAKKDGQDALEWLEGNLPDLIICDLQMPNMDGYSFLEKVRQRGFTKHTPVVMLSANGEKSEDRIKCYQLGAQDFLAKPFSPVELIELVKKNLDPIHYAIKW